MPRTEPRACPAGLHQLGPHLKTRRGCPACQRDVDLARVVSWVAALDPTLEPAGIVGAVDAAAPSEVGRRALMRHLETDPGVLTAGSSATPNVVCRFISELAAAGATGVTAPGCARCGVPKRRLENLLADGTRVCNGCYRELHPVACVGCGGVKPHGRRDADGVLCGNCARRALGALETCGRCGQPGVVAARVEGDVVCTGCYRAPTRPCGNCGQVAPVVSRRSGMPLCPRCYRRPYRACGRCGRVGPIGRRAIGDDPELCDRCAQPPVATCLRCGQERPCHFVSEGRPVCIRCSPQRPSRCAHCGRDRAATAQWPEGPVCGTCYGQALRRRGRCAGCGQERRLVSPPGRQAQLCCDCAGLPPGPTCGRCGIEDKIYQGDRCARCVLADRTAALLSGPDGTIPPPLLPVYESIVTTRSALGGINWLRRGASPALLADVAAGLVPLTHDGLDTLPRGMAVGYLREMLVANGVLARRDEPLAGLERWIDENIERVDDPGDRRLVAAYASWRVLRGTRRRAERAVDQPTSTRWATDRVNAAIAFLAWLAEHEQRLEDCRQADVDRWLIEGRRSHYDVRDFLRWAADRKAVSPLSVPPKRWATGSAMADNDRWQLTRRLLHDDSLDLVDRVTGSFVLLFAQQPGRIARMTLDDITPTPDGVAVRFGNDPVAIPQPLAGLVLQLASDRSRRGGIGAPATATPWLFPGHLPGRPISSNWLGQRLNRLGINARASRRAALLQLAAEVPAPVLADLLGIATRTAVSWVAAAGGNWARYAADRARTEASKSTTT